MAEIAHAFAEETTPQSTTSATYVDVSANAVLASSNFVAGGVYLISVTALNRGSNTAAITGIQVVHGASTAFADSVMEQEQNGSSIRLPYRWHTVWTAVSGERIALQQRSNGTDTSTVDQVTMIAIRLDADLTENTHWFQNERTTDDALGTTYVDGASITFTPATAGDYLIIGHEQLEPSSTTISVKSRLDVAGDIGWESIQEGEAATPTDESRCAAHVAIVNLTASSKTVKLQAAATAASGGTRLNSKLFIIRLDIFEKYTFAYTEGALAGTATEWADAVQTVSHTPTTAGDTWVGCFSINDHEATGNGFFKRLQVDNTDQPATQTSDIYPEGSIWDAVDQMFSSIETIENLTAAAHTIDVDGHVSAATAGRDWNERLAFAISMEIDLAASINAEAGSYLIDGKSAGTFTPFPTLLPLWRQRGG